MITWERGLSWNPVTSLPGEVAFFCPWKIKNSLIPTEAVSPKPVSARPSGTEISQDLAPAGTDLQRVLFPSLGWKASQPPASVLGILSVKLFLWALTVTIPSAHSSWHS